MPQWQHVVHFVNMPFMGIILHTGILGEGATAVLVPISGNPLHPGLAVNCCATL